VSPPSRPWVLPGSHPGFDRSHRPSVPASLVGHWHPDPTVRPSQRPWAGAQAPDPGVRPSHRPWAGAQAARSGRPSVPPSLGGGAGSPILASVRPTVPTPKLHAQRLLQRPNKQQSIAKHCLRRDGGLAHDT